MAELRRVISMPMLVFYGLGNILGAGIYVLVGEVAGVSGYHAPLVFALASLLIVPTALSYAELSARFPLSAGEAVYLDEAFGVRWLSVIVGLFLAGAGMVSTAALVRGFAGYLAVLVELPEPVVLVVLVLSLGLLCASGIGLSVRVAATLTLVEIGGLLLVLWVAGDHFAELPARLGEVVPSADPAVWRGIVAGAFLAFFAFLGFEDMVNVAEEVRDPSRDRPRAIVVALVVATALYVAVAAAAVLTVTPGELASTGAPLAVVYERASGRAPTAITVIGLFAAVNGALVQIIMSSRIFYGMSRQGWLPARLGRVGARTGTPLLATVLVTVVVLLLSVALDLVTLAWLTSLIILTVFTLINLALWRIKGQGHPAIGAPDVPRWLPLAGALGSFAFIVVSLVAR